MKKLITYLSEKLTKNKKSIAKLDKNAPLIENNTTSGKNSLALKDNDKEIEKIMANVIKSGNVEKINTVE